MHVGFRRLLALKRSGVGTGRNDGQWNYKDSFSESNTKQKISLINQRTSNKFGESLKKTLG